MIGRRERGIIFNSALFRGRKKLTGEHERIEKVTRKDLDLFIGLI